MNRITMTALTALTLLPTAPLAAPAVERVRGTIESVDAGSLLIKMDDGTSQTVALAGDTKYASVVKSSLDAVKDGAFIGTATKGEEALTALEVVVFPEAMRGTGEGHYAWDEIRDTTAGGGTKTRSAMTNGTVKPSAAAPKIKSAMTNGTVSGAVGGERTVTVTYGAEGSKTITIPPSTPVVTFEPADGAILKPGGHAFVTAAREDGKLTARRVAVGKDGLRPPM